MLVLPPFQLQGHATRLVEAIHSEVRTDSSVFDLLVEDPSEEFIRLRDFLDCRDALQLSCFRRESIKEELVTSITMVENIRYNSTTLTYASSNTFLISYTAVSGLEITVVND